MPERGCVEDQSQRFGRFAVHELPQRLVFDTAALRLFKTRS
jgi:hypothetical protein